MIRWPPCDKGECLRRSQSQMLHFLICMLSLSLCKWGLFALLNIHKEGLLVRVFGAPRHDRQKNILGKTLRQIPKLKLHLMGVN